MHALFPQTLQVPWQLHLGRQQHREGDLNHDRTGSPIVQGVEKPLEVNRPQSKTKSKICKSNVPFITPM